MLQWIIHFRERISESESWNCVHLLKLLELSESSTLRHIPECFHKFTLNFIEGAGEKLMGKFWRHYGPIWTKWRTRTSDVVAHHQEVIDDNMNDSNWRKMIRIGKHLYYLSM